MTGRIILILLTLLPWCTQAADLERGFRNYDRLQAGDITPQQLTAEERNEIKLIENTLQQLENEGEPLDPERADCLTLEHARSRQGHLLASSASRLASCARRHDQAALAALASRLNTCAGSAAQGGLQDCNSVIARIRVRRDGQCVDEIRAAEREQRRLTSLRLRTAEVCGQVE